MPPIVPRQKVAEHFGVMPNAVREWEDLGLPIYGTEVGPNGGRPRKMYDLEAVQAWREQNANPTHKSSNVVATPSVLGGEDGPTDEAVDDPDCLDPAVLSRLSVADLKRKTLAEELVMLKLKRMEQESKLRKAGDVQAKWIEAVRTVSQRVQRMGPEIVDALCGIGNGVVIPIDQRGAVRNTVDGIIDRHLAEFRKGED